MRNKELSVIIGVNARSACGDTLLQIAVERQDRSDVATLIEFGADVNAIGDLGSIPLHDAASRGLVEITAQLVKAGAKRDIKNEFGQTPIDLARLMQRDERLRDTLRALEGR